MGDAQRGQAPFPLCVSIGRYGAGTVGKLVPTRRILVHFSVVAGQFTRAVQTMRHWRSFCPCLMTHLFKPAEFHEHVSETKLWPRNRTFCKNGHATRGILSLNAPASSLASAACPLVFVDLNGFPEADLTCVALISVLCLFPLALMMWTRQEWSLHQPGAASGKMNTICCLLLHIS